MTKHISVVTITIFGILLFFCRTAWKSYVLYSKYPDPQIQTYQYGERVRSGSYEITFSGWQWGNENLIKAKFPDFELVHSGSDGKSEDVRVGLINFTITKISEGKDILDLSNIGFSSGAWGNQFDLELFYLLNPELHNIALALDVGEIQHITLPLTVLESQFTAAQWTDIDNREFYINIQYYPAHIRFTSNSHQILLPHKQIP